MTARSANTDDIAHLDIMQEGFETCLNVSTNRLIETSSVYRKHEQPKKHEYEQHITKVEHGVFSSLFSHATTSGSGREVTTFTKSWLADICFSEKATSLYPVVMGWLKCQLSFLHSEYRACAFKAADPPFTILSMDQTSLQHNPRDGCTLTNICEPFDLLYNIAA